jgi:hypothetical protein
MAARTYIKGAVYRVRMDGHPEPLDLTSIEVDGFCAGGGLMLVMDRGDGEVDRIVALLNSAEREADYAVPHPIACADALKPAEVTA